MKTNTLSRRKMLRNSGLALGASVLPGIVLSKTSSKNLNEHNFTFCLNTTLELFNPDYWKQDPLVVAKTGLEKMKQSVQKALS